MLNTRGHFSILVLTGFFICAFAVIVTYVATAQTRSENADGDQVKMSESAAPVQAADSGNRKAIEAVDAIAKGPYVGETNGAQTSQESAKPVTIVGRALDDRDRGRPGAVITLHEANGALHSATSDRFGNFRFDKIIDGQRIVLSAGSETNDELDLTLELNGETRVFWRTPGPETKTRNGK